MTPSRSESHPGTRPIPITDQPLSAPTETARVAAVIVTHNRLPKLRQALGAVRAQTHPCAWIIVINNDSTDGTRAYLDSLVSGAADGGVGTDPDRTAEPQLVALHLDENLGGAGGFEHGMAVGHRLGADFVWVMDDDCYPEPDALEVLLSQRELASASIGREVPYACSVVTFTDGSLSKMNNPKTSWDWARTILGGLNALLITECTFVSVIIPRWAIDEKGLPLGEYFIWYDDKEYTKRLKRSYGPGIVALGSRVVHDMAENAGVNYRHVTEKNLWKFEKGARNQASYRLHFEGRLAYINFCVRVHQELRAGKVPGPVKRRIYQALNEARSFRPNPRYPSDPRYAHDLATAADRAQAASPRLVSSASAPAAVPAAGPASGYPR